jgi:DNA polymerase
LVQLDILRKEVAGCVKCPQLAAARTQTVFGVGNPQARLCFFGEAPGADEDRQGEPFVGRAGQLLTKIIEACTLKREDVYILNVLKCRPPENRTPLPDEVVNCRGYFERQFDILKPEFICCLGTTAAQSLLQTDETIGKLRGRFHEYRGATVLCTYHPSYLLRNPAAKKDVWEDMKVLMRKMGVELT